ncbi:MAG: BadF/BadG/BcrA/BcrD ATPase family protein [Pseudomonadota bacterium]
MSELPEVLAVDGGGTRCRVAAVLNGRTRVAESGCANVSNDLDGAIESIGDALGALAAEMGLDPGALHGIPTFAGLAGVTGTEVVSAVAARLPFRRLRVEDDRAAAIRGALGGQDGAIAHCGTGSFFAVQRGGVVRASGGWGADLGDEASAMWVGRAVLAEVLNVHDGLSQPSALTESLLDHIGSPTEIVRFARRATPADFGGLAPRVTAAAVDGDAVAQRVVRRGADFVAGLLPRLGWQVGMPVCLTGGMARFYTADLRRTLSADVVAPIGEPIDGAVALALEFRREIEG